MEAGIKHLARKAAEKFLLLPHFTDSDIRKSAWTASEGMVEWQRRMIYGYLMQRFSTPTMKKIYAKKEKYAVDAAIAEMKESC